MAEEKSNKIQNVLAKPIKFEKQDKNTAEYEEISENYNIKGKQHKQICCIKDDEKKTDKMDNKNSSEEYFESNTDKKVHQKPVKIIQNNNVVDLNAYNEKKDDTKKDK
eukprot:242895_1